MTTLAQPSASGIVAFARNRLLGALSPDDFDRIAPHLRETALEPGSVLHEPDQPIQRICFPSGGLVSLMALLPDGQAIDTVTIGREGAVGLSAAIGSPTARTRALVQLPGRALAIPAARMAEVAERSPSLRGVIVRYGEIVMAQVQQNVVCNTAHPIQARLCRWLLQARDRTGADTLAVTQELLSTVLGVQRTTITLVARVLQTEGILQVRRGRIIIGDAAALEEKACDCYRHGRRLVEHIGRGAIRQFAQQPLRPETGREIQPSSSQA